MNGRERQDIVLLSLFLTYIHDK